MTPAEIAGLADSAYLAMLRAPRAHGKMSAAAALEAYALEDKETGCLVWTRNKSSKGYGQISILGVLHPTHRVAWELKHGRVPEGLVVDHLCRNRACANVAHLRVTTSRGNTMAGVGHASRNAAKTSCPHGHKYDRLHRRLERFTRRCSKCARAANDRYRAKQRTLRATAVKERP